MDLLLGFDLCKIPVGTPPKGQAPNFINPDTLESETIGVCVAITALAVTFVALRLFANRKHLKLGDYLILVGTMFSIGFTVVVLSIAKYYRHFWDIPACWMTGDYMKVTYANTTLVGPAMYFSKTSILLMLLQVFAVQRRDRILIYIGLVATFLIYFPSIPLSAIYTAPRIGHSWDELLTNGEPQKLIYWGIVQGSLATALDIYIFILPLPALAKLKLPMRKKLQVGAAFATAIFGVASSVLALYFRVDGLTNKDTTWNQATLAMAVVVENNVAIIVASMPAFASFMRTSVFQSSVFKSLQSRLNKGQSSGPSSKGSGDSSWPKRKVETFGGGGGGTPRHHHKVPEYHELTETDTTTLMAPSQPGFGQNDHYQHYGHGGYGYGEHENGNNIKRTTVIMQESYQARGDLSSNHV